MAARDIAQQRFTTLKKQFDACESDIEAYAVAINIRGATGCKNNICEIWYASINKGFTVTARMLHGVLQQLDNTVHTGSAIRDMFYGIADYSPSEIHGFLQEYPYLKTNGILRCLRAMSTDVGADTVRAVIAMMFNYPAELASINIDGVHESIRATFVTFTQHIFGECDGYELLCTIAKTVELHQHIKPEVDLTNYIIAKLGTAKLVELDSWMLYTEQHTAHKLCAALNAN